MSALAVEAKPCTRGTSNSNARGSSTDRRRRKEWLVMTYRANVDAVWLINDDGVVIVWEADELDLFAVPACRCYRCGDLLVFENVTVDRIVPGCMGGTYRRNNIRPACAGCNSETGGKLSRKPKRRRR